MLRHWFGEDAAKERVTIGANGFDVQLAAANKAFNPTSASAVHRVGDDCAWVGFQAFEINDRSDVMVIIVIRFDDVDGAFCLAFGKRDFGGRMLAQLGFDECCDFGCRCAAEGGFEFVPIKVRRVM